MTCGKTLSECADDNKDHKCDLCGKTLSECADDNKDHKCDLCGKTLSECADDNKDLQVRPVRQDAERVR